MKPIELKVARIGNSRGVRLPATTLARFGIGNTVIMEETAEGILLRPQQVVTPKLSWLETAQAMAESGEDWGDWDVTSSDGLEELPWEAAVSRRVAEPNPRAYDAMKRGKKKR